MRKAMTHVQHLSEYDGHDDVDSERNPVDQPNSPICKARGKADNGETILE